MPVAWSASPIDPSEKLEKKLDEALLNTQLDITYAHEMNVQITDTINMMKKVYKSTKCSGQLTDEEVFDLARLSYRLVSEA